MTRNQHLAAITRMVLAVAVFAIMDAGLKGLTPHYPPLEIVALRSFASLPLLLTMLTWRRINIFAVKGRFVYVFRSFFSLMMIATFVYSVGRQGLTDAYAVFMSAPLLVALLSTVVLKEHISKLRWLSICVGLIGVILALHPTGLEMFSDAGLAALATAFFYAINVLSIRALHPSDSAEAVVFWNIFGMAVMSTLAAVSDWHPVRPEDWMLIALVGTAGALAQHFLTVAFRMAPASVVAPFEYTALIWGGLIDLSVFHHTPAPQVVIGAIVVTAAGIGLIIEDRLFAHKHQAEPDASQPLP